MSQPTKPFVHIAIDAVDTVVFDPEGRYDPDKYDRYPTYESARDAALSSVELMLDAADYDGEDHRLELEEMREILESAPSFDHLVAQKAYHSLLRRLTPVAPIAA